jgi:hypothetical protein
VSHLALEVHDDATKTEWNARCYREYRRLLDEESMRLCDIYVKTQAVDPSIHIRREVRT